MISMAHSTLILLSDEGFVNHTALMPFAVKKPSSLATLAPDMIENLSVRRARDSACRRLENA